MKRGIYLLMVLLTNTFFISSARAATYNIEGGDQVINGIGSFFHLSNPGWQLVLLCVLFFILFFIAISKIIRDFSGFSSWFAWILGIVLAVIGAITGVIGRIESIFYNLGFIVALIINAFIFFGTYLFEWIINKRIGRNKELKKIKEEADAEVAKEYNKAIAEVISKA